MPTSFRVRPLVFQNWNNGGTLQYVHNGETYPSASVPTKGRSMSDYFTVDDPYPVHYPLDMVTYRYRPWAVSGTNVPASPFFHNYFRYVEGPQRKADYSTLKSFRLLPDWSSLVTQAITQANPNAPHTDLSVFLFELREFPRMLFDLKKLLRGEVSPRDVPGGHLAVEFGWKPFLSDMNTLFNVAQAINDRYYYLKGLKDKGKKRFRRTLYENSYIPTSYSHTMSYSDTYTTYMSEIIVHAEYNLTVSGEIPFSPFYGTKPAALPALLSNPDASAFVYGLRSPQLDSVWNAIPWTFLIDWFTNIGDVLESNRPGLIWDVNHMWLTSDSKVKAKVESVDSRPGITHRYHGSGSYRYRARRFYLNPQARFEINPAFTRRQFALLGSLLTAGAMRRSRYQG